MSERPEPSGGSGSAARLRAAFAAASGPPSAAGCSEPEEIWAASRGEGTPGRRDALLLHSAACGACAEAWRLAREIAEEAGLGPVSRLGPERSAPGGRFTWPMGGALAAAAILAGVLLVAPRLTRSPAPLPSGAIRSEAAETIRSLIPENTPVPRDALVLRWEGPPGATYDLEIVTEALEPVASFRGLTSGAQAVPPGLLPGLDSGSVLIWRVEATLHDGRNVTSPAFIVRIE